jgi:hypothetical protein
MYVRTGTVIASKSKDLGEGSCGKLVRVTAPCYYVLIHVSVSSPWWSVGWLLKWALICHQFQRNQVELPWTTKDRHLKRDYGRTKKWYDWYDFFDWNPEKRRERTSRFFLYWGSVRAVGFNGRKTSVIGFAFNLLGLSHPSSVARGGKEIGQRGNIVVVSSPSPTHAENWLAEKPAINGSSLWSHSPLPCLWNNPSPPSRILFLCPLYYLLITLVGRNYVRKDPLSIDESFLYIYFMFERNQR